jgi:putative membrane protein
VAPIRSIPFPNQNWAFAQFRRLISQHNIQSKEIPTVYYVWGMHGYWWIFWILIWICFFSFMMPVRRTTYRQLQSPLQVLQRRYAAGEITSEEYEERRAKLLRDANMK